MSNFVQQPTRFVLPVIHLETASAVILVMFLREARALFLILETPTLIARPTLVRAAVCVT